MDEREREQKKSDRLIASRRKQRIKNNALKRGKKLTSQSNFNYIENVRLANAIVVCTREYEIHIINSTFELSTLQTRNSKESACSKSKIIDVELEKTIKRCAEHKPNTILSSPFSLKFCIEM